MNIILKASIGHFKIYQRKKSPVNTIPTILIQMQNPIYI